LVPLADGAFLWSSEASGFKHLAVHNPDGSVRTQLTSGGWAVDETSRELVDESGGTVYFAANGGDPRERHLFRVPLAGGSVRRVTREEGMHHVVPDRAFTQFVDKYHGVDAPVSVRVCSLADGTVLRVLFASTHPDLLRLRPHLQPPELLSFPSTDGKVRLYGALYRPPADVFGPGPYPLMVQVYGGPHVQLVQKSWGATADLRAHHLRLQGYLVLKVDNRGSARRGHAFEGALHKHMGDIELLDQIAGVAHCVQRQLADPKRVGIMGWSYGGYMSAMAVAKHGDVFKAGIAGAPVTSWDGYDTHYTERYMSLPADNPDGYRESSVMSHVHTMPDTAALLLIHGLLDENVHWRHTARLCTALTRARKPYELLAFPDERHQPRSVADRVYMEERMMKFIRRHV